MATNPQGNSNSPQANTSSPQTQGNNSPTQRTTEETPNTTTTSPTLGAGGSILASTQTSQAAADPEAQSNNAASTPAAASPASENAASPSSAQSSVTRSQAGNNTPQNGPVQSNNEIHASVTPSSAQSAAGASASTSGVTSGGKDSTPFSTGELAGGIVGSLFGAALITFLATWFFCRTRRQRRPSSPRRYHSEEPRSGTRSGKGLAAVTEKPSSSSDSDTFSWQAYLPQSADDRSIQNAVKTLFDQIELHVDNYYRKANVELDDSTFQALAHIDSGKLPGPITDLVTNQRMVLSAIKHCIADLLVTRMSPGEDTSTSLLPGWLAVMPPKLESVRPSAEGHGQCSHSCLESFCGSFAKISLLQL